MRFMIALAATTCLAAMPAAAQDVDAEIEADSGFELGRITIVGRRLSGLAPTGSTLSAEAMLTFDRTTLDTAVNLMPGVNGSNSGGMRNERLIFVRGFDRLQVPLSIDGIRVYLPADNRLDFGRFLTPDIAEIQVSKGYASVLDGPGAMGGAINLVTRRPTSPFEVEARGTSSFDGEGEQSGSTVFGLVGASRDLWYAQVSYARTDVDHWSLSDDFVPTSPAAEDGGERDFSATEDWRANVKVGFTPNATDEYTLSYTVQEGSKNAPLNVINPLNGQRFWDWPYWNIDSLYFLSTTAFGDNVELKTRVYHNTFDNLLRSFDDRSQTVQTRPFAFNSYYEDEATGGSAQLALDIADIDTLTLAAHYRKDTHVEYQQVFPSRLTEPRQTNEEETYSVAIENRAEIAPSLTFTAGFSFDWRDLKRAEEVTLVAGAFPYTFFPLVDAEDANGQARLDWAASDATNLHASVSSRSRFPTVMERFSTRFGSAESNPGLDTEEALTYEIGGSHEAGVWRVEGALFYSELTNGIFSFPTVFQSCTGSSCQNVTLNQSRNVGEAEYYGGEIAASARLSDALLVGGNYTHIERDVSLPPNAVDPSLVNFQPTGVPTDKGFVFLEWRPIGRLAITPNVDFASERWTSRSIPASGSTPASTIYFETGDYALYNLTAELDITDQVSIGAGGRNLADENVILTDGFPEPGRSWFVSIQARY